MSVELLATKLYAPPARKSLVLRPRLTQKLNTGLDRKLTLISAPAGFGKTTLLAHWIRQLNVPTAWVSLDEADNELFRFLSYLVFALKKLEPAFGGKHDDGNLVHLEVLSHCATDFIPVQHRHHNVEDNQVGGDLGYPLERDLSIARRENLIARFLERELENLDYVWFVIDDQNSVRRGTRG